MTSTSRPDGGRRGLQIVLGTLAAIPFASGLAGVLVGPRALPGENAAVTASVDSEYRYTHAMWFTAGPILWSVLPRIERETAVLRVVSGAVFIGGLARLVSWRSAGRPHPALIGATALELAGIPALVAWQHRVATLAGDA
jgi:Domain of unknown function (DUF4345)